MFDNENVIEFVNKIVNESKEDEKELANNIKKFKEYLELTKMGDDKVIEWLNRVITCLPELISLKNKLKNIDASTLVDFNTIIVNSKNVKKLTKKSNEKLNDEKHYHHYTRSTSYNCGGGSTSSSCGSVSTTSCGGSTTRSGC